MSIGPIPGVQKHSTFFLAQDLSKHDLSSTMEPIFICCKRFPPTNFVRQWNLFFSTSRHICQELWRNKVKCISRPCSYCKRMGLRTMGTLVLFLKYSKTKSCSLQKAELRAFYKRFTNSIIGTRYQLLVTSCKYKYQKLDHFLRWNSSNHSSHFQNRKEVKRMILSTLFLMKKLSFFRKKTDQYLHSS